MSTVLWANVLQSGKVVSDRADKYVLHKYADKLDAISRKLNLGSFLEICDNTDMKYNIQDLELPAGMESTDEVMAKEGKWIEIAQAVTMLEGLLEHIQHSKVRFGLLKNEHDDIVAELAEAITYAKNTSGLGIKFNFSIVM